MESPHESKKIEWHTDILPLKTRRALEFLSTQDWIKQDDWYLAGGTAFALHEGYRVSLDLDFFYPRKNFNLTSLLSSLSGDEWEVNIAEEGTVYASLLGAKVSFIAYPFFVYKQKPQWFGTIRVLQPRDIAVMKIIAVSQRGRKRDFVDLYWYAKNRGSLVDILSRLPEQYPTVAHDYHQILKSFMYFEDAEQDPMPKLFFNTTWREIKTYFRREVPRIAKELLKLP